MPSWIMSSQNREARILPVNNRGRGNWLYQSSDKSAESLGAYVGCG